MRTAARASLLFLAPLLFACHHPNHGVPGDGGASDGGADGSTSDSGVSDMNLSLVVTPDSLQTITVTTGAQTPTVAYMAMLGGSPVDVAWNVDRANLATIAAGPSSTGTLTPTGTVGGLVTVTARLGSQSLTRQVFIKLASTAQNGANPNNPAEAKQIPMNPGDLSAGGGVGGVGGEGLGGAVSDPATMTALGAPASNGSAQMLKLLYPYDATVWPRGMLAPLLMWSWSQPDTDAVKIDIATTSGSFSWSGTFAKPAILGSSPFIRHPIPQDVWTEATETAGGPTPNNMPDKLIVKVTLAKGGVGYGPITETWTIAPVHLTGTVYYNSYGTKYVKNWVNPDKAGNPVGAAILSVRSGDTAPKLVIGQNSPLGANGIPTNDSGCRVCHVVASRGRWIITQSEQGTPGDGRSFLYDLNSSNVQTSVVQLTQEGVFGWAAMVGDASYALTNMVNPSSSNPAIGATVSQLATFGPTPGMTMPTLSAVNGLPSGLKAGYPSYSPDDTLIAYVDATSNTGDLAGQPLATASYDSATQQFSKVQTVWTPPMGQRVGYPGFLPDNSAIVFEHQIQKSSSDSVVVTRNCARSELYWTKSNQAVALDAANGHASGASYLPVGNMNHGSYLAGDPQCNDTKTTWDDTSLNYEPTVLPVVEGGYAWVVFTSRRLYGNQLTQFPFNSWPPNYDTTKLSDAPVKKLWVTAIDLNAPAGADPSHPAFYLPAQEILAGNSRGFWVLDPCRTDGTSCDSGDECCNGYCEPDPKTGAPVCTSQATCSNLQEKCTTAADCCDQSNVCANGFCAASSPIL